LVYSCGAASGNRKDIIRRIRWHDFNLKNPIAWRRGAADFVATS